MPGIKYASATGASEPLNMAYMCRIDFLGSVERHGVGSMEIVAMEMKRKGKFIVIREIIYISIYKGLVGRISRFVKTLVSASLVNWDDNNWHFQ
ncbi:hypothetical protein DAPPUDRAFT_329802 [Daphnia pulex]|uniref:Strawberry notch AAA domain-containing protein n=1 Tax=Daphnia pulex TaxID=6669 RepID=E9HHN7_DAPPU|nr:hypothetical protein DAPPUDRAFT_329802 [Daphnia pulex]|eukprot:EFX68736.1 hypothetical protein DAPPUDRAFT_329802 [Daphnia pulex]